LGLPQLGDESRARLSETIQHTLYGGMIAPTLLLGGLLFAVYRNSREDRVEADREGPQEAAEVGATAATQDEEKQS
jgi:hypothetical protein